MGWALNLWRGYTDRDRLTLKGKLCRPHAVGAVIHLTRGEFNCWKASGYDCQPMFDAIERADQRHLQSGNDPW